MIVYGLAISNTLEDAIEVHPTFYKNKGRVLALQRLFKWRTEKANRAFNILTNTLSNDVQKKCADTLYAKYRIYRNKAYKIITFEVE